MKTCEMTMSKPGPLGFENYWKCGRPAKFRSPPGDPLHPQGINVCGIHARAIDQNTKRYQLKRPKCQPLRSSVL